MFANTDRLGRRMDELRLDGIIATTYENVYYLTGVGSVALEMFPHAGQCFAVLSRADLTRPYFICSRCEVDQFLDAIPTLGGAIGYGQFYRELPDGVALTPDEARLREAAVDGPTPSTAVEALASVLRQAGLTGSRVGLDEDGVTSGLLDAAGDVLRGTDIHLAADVLRWARKVKTATEIERVAAAAAVAQAGLQAAAGIAQPGVTERDLVREFDRAVATAGARPKFTLIKFGRAAVAGQTRPSDVPLRRGDAIWFDVGGVHDGYWFDIARVYCMGEPSEKVARYYGAMLAGEERALAEARPGMAGKELFDLTVEAVREAGVPHYRRHHVGHGIGVEVYDRVLITPANDDLIEEGTVVNIETPYYEFGLGAVQVEDPFVVRADGNQLLTTLDRRLSIID